MTALATTNPAPHPSLNELHTSDARGAGEERLRYATALMTYSRSQAATADGSTLIVYDEPEAHATFNQLMRVLGASRVRRLWKADRAFEPEWGEDRRESAFRNWKRAVERTRGWIEEESGG